MIKKIVLAVVLLFTIISNGWCEDANLRLDPREVAWYSVPTNTKVTYVLPNSAAYSQRFDLYKMVGFFALQMAVSTTMNATNYGKLNVEYHVSNDGIKYVSPTGASRIFTGISCQSMTFFTPWNYVHNGNTIYSPTADITDTGYMMSAVIPVPPFRYMKLYVKETHGNREVTPTAKLSVQ